VSNVSPLIGDGLAYGQPANRAGLVGNITGDLNDWGYLWLGDDILLSCDPALVPGNVQGSSEFGREPSKSR